MADRDVKNLRNADREVKILRNVVGLAFYSVMILLEGNFRTATLVGGEEQLTLLCAVVNLGSLE
jgi:hypothetical protein